MFVALLVCFRNCYFFLNFNFPLSKTVMVIPCLERCLRRFSRKFGKVEPRDLLCVTFSPLYHSVPNQGQSVSSGIHEESEKWLQIQKKKGAGSSSWGPGQTMEQVSGTQGSYLSQVRKPRVWDSATKRNHVEIKLGMGQGVFLIVALSFASVWGSSVCLAKV